MLTHTPTPDSRPGTVTAVLGPTNTGKTHLAIERMLGHASGMIGFPLRLLARENYDRVVQKKGRGQVALVTGEEKILPPNPRYFLCTVESMPVDRPVEFLAIDEVQLCADPDRGHVFTDRLLHARGLSETMFLGSDTMRGMIRELVPRAEITSRPRFSTLTYAGARKLTKLPPRSAVVAFSANDVYATAELMRRNRGGTAVVLGALSPRTRNAQVQMFEEGEVDYLVATDAIGMGLNLNLDHVAFAKLSKFDGRAPRRLTPAEIGQIAGRAGRHMADGTFGTTANVGDIEPEVVEAVEAHRFDPVQALCWRNRELDFKSPEALIKSLEAQPPSPALTKARDAEDYEALRALARDPEIAALAGDPGAVRLLWEVCQIPDFRKTLSDQHTRLLGQIYRHLMSPEGNLPEDWVGQHLERLDRTEGDIDTLVQRIAHVRTWTYVTHRADWLADTAHWQARARQIEDRLSDALHEGLTQRFVDRRTAALVKRLKDGSDLIGAVRKGGEVLVEGEFVGRLHGFRFELDGEAKGDDKRPLQAAARRALAGEIPRRVQKLESDDDGAIALTDTGVLTWRGEVVGRLEAGTEPLKPKVVADDSDFLDGAQRERIRKRLSDWFERHRRNKLAKLLDLSEAELPARARGLAFQLAEALGTIDRREVAEHVRGLGKSERKALAGLGVRLGRESVWLPAMLHPQALRMKALLTAVHQGRAAEELPADRAVAFRPGAASDDATCRALGYRRIEPARRGGKRSRQQKDAVAVRVDALERLAGALHKLNPRGPFTPTEDLAGILAGDRAALDVALPALGYHPFGADGDTPAFRPRGRPGRRAPGAPAGPARAADGGLAPATEEAPRRRRGKPRRAPAEDAPTHNATAGDGEPAGGGAAPSDDASHGKGRPPRKRKGQAQGKSQGKSQGQAGRPKGGKPAPSRPQEIDPDHPFAKLKDITFAK